MMLTSAWEQHCREEGLDHTLAKAKDAWRRAQITKSTGCMSLTQVPGKGKKYIQLMAHMEVIARNGIDWQMKLTGADTRPIVHSIREICREHDLEEDYVRGVARKALKLDSLPLLDSLGAPQLLTVLQLLRMNVARMALAAGKGDT